MPLDIAIEGVLFYRGTPVKKAELIKLFSCTDEDLETALQSLKDRLTSGALRLIQTEREVQMVTASELDELIESIRKDELRRDIGKAGAETLAVVLYKGPVTRADIDRIRGVNSAFILRNLLVRGLVERTPEGKTHTFDVTPELLAHLGITNKLELPEYATVLDQLERFEKQITENTE